MILAALAATPKAPFRSSRQYSFSKNLDVYGGISYSQARGGVSGYINDDLASYSGQFEVLGYFRLPTTVRSCLNGCEIVAVGVRTR